MGLGAGELILILVIAYVVVGPEDMVKLAGTIAKTLRQLRKLSTDLRGEVEGELRLSSMKMSDIDPDKIVKETIKNDAAGSVSADLDSVLKEIQKAEEQMRTS